MGNATCGVAGQRHVHSRVASKEPGEPGRHIARMPELFPPAFSIGQALAAMLGSDPTDVEPQLRLEAIDLAELAVDRRCRHLKDRAAELEPGSFNIDKHIGVGRLSPR